LPGRFDLRCRAAAASRRANLPSRSLWKSAPSCARSSASDRVELWHHPTGRRVPGLFKARFNAFSSARTSPTTDTCAAVDPISRHDRRPLVAADKPPVRRFYVNVVAWPKRRIGIPATPRAPPGRMVRGL